MGKKDVDMFYVVKIGTDERPAGDEDIKAMKKKLKKLKKNIPSFKHVSFLVTHHAVDIQSVYCV